MRLKMTPLLFYIVIIAYLITNCKNSPMDVVDKGQLQMRISFAEEINKASTIRESAIIDQITVTVSNSNGGVIASTNLTQSGTTWQGSLELDPANNLTVNVEAFENSVLNYAGSSSGVNVQAGQTTQVGITLSSLAPTACFTVTPDAGDRITTFSFDASCSSDPREMPLQVRWDFEDDGTFDTQSSSTKTATHQYSTVGPKTIRLEVINTGGLTGEGGTTNTINVAENHAIFNIQLSPPSPASLLFDQFVDITFDYVTDEAGGVRIWPQPYSNGSFIGAGAFSLSPVYPAGNGSGTGFITVLSSALDFSTVDQTRFLMTSADQSQTLLDTLIDVGYVFASHTISNIQLSPSSPASLGFNQRVNITFDYTTTQIGGVRIWPQPYSNGSFTSGGGFSPSAVFAAGNGSGTGFITVLSGPSGGMTVDQIRFLMTSADQSQTSLVFFVPVEYNFSP